MTYSGAQKKVYEHCFMKQKCQPQMGITQYKNTVTPLRTRGINTTHRHFQMRYITFSQLKNHQPKNFKVSSFQIERDLTFLLQLITFQHLELKQSYIPHLKVLMCDIDASGAQWCGYVFIFCYTHLKLALLLDKTALS